VRVDDHAIVEKGSTIVSGKVTEVGPGYIVLEHLIGSLAMAKDWRLTHVITMDDIYGDKEPAES